MPNFAGKTLAALAVLIIALLIALHFVNRGSPDASATVLPAAHATAKSDDPFYPVPVTRAQPLPGPDTAGQSGIPREKVEAWLAAHNRNAISLLAAFHALHDTNYLNEAATHFPDNPQVELAVLAHGEFPQDRRKWLNLFEKSSPSNSLANYLSAQSYFATGNTNAAIQELMAASGKSQFDAFLTESRLNEEDLFQASGYSTADSGTESMAGMADDNVGQLSTLKQLVVKMNELQKAEMSAGDSGSAANLAQMGMMLANQLDNGDSGKYFINQLVSMAIENAVLHQLDPNTSYDFLDGQTPSQILAQNQAQKAAFRELHQNFQAAYPDLTPDEMQEYLQRQKIYGEMPAAQWVIQQHPPTAAPNGQP